MRKLYRKKLEGYKEGEKETNGKLRREGVVHKEIRKKEREKKVRREWKKRGGNKRNREEGRG